MYVIVEMGKLPLTGLNRDDVIKQAYNGNILQESEVEPSKFYTNIQEAEEDCAKLNSYNQKLFVVWPIRQVALEK